MWVKDMRDEQGRDDEQFDGALRLRLCVSSTQQDWLSPVRACCISRAATWALRERQPTVLSTASSGWLFLPGSHNSSSHHGWVFFPPSQPVITARSCKHTLAKGWGDGGGRLGGVPGRGGGGGLPPEAARGSRTTQASMACRR